MGRVSTMARFAEPDEPKKIGECESCESNFYAGDTILLFDGDFFCDVECLIESIPYEDTTLEEGER